jgi:hypothetical protein
MGSFSPVSSCVERGSVVDLLSLMAPSDPEKCLDDLRIKTSPY